MFVSTKMYLIPKERTEVINDINKTVKEFEEKTKTEVHVSGLPLIRTVVADRIQNEMKYFLFGSLLLSTLILLLFFRSISTTLLSLLVVVLGVIWSVGVLYLCGYQITLLTAFNTMPGGGNWHTQLHLLHQ